MRRGLGYLAVGVAAIGLAIAVVVGDFDDDREAASADDSLAGVYRIASARVGAVEQPALVGRVFIVRRDGPELVAGLCPDVATCRRWLEQTPAFRHSLASLPVAATLADADPETVLSAAHVVGVSTATTITTADGRCRRRVDNGSLEPTEIGLRLRRELAQTELVVDCDAHPTSDRVALELMLVRMALE